MSDLSADRTPRADSKGFRPGSRRRARIAAGAALAAVAIGGNVLLYTSLDDRTEVLQLVSNVRAGEVVTTDDLRIVEVDVDPTVPVVSADEIGSVVGRYAVSYLASGTLVSPFVLQAEPLITPGTSVVAVELDPGRVPADVRERSLVDLIVVDGPDTSFRATARVVTRPESASATSGRVSMSVEVPAADAAALAAGDDVRMVLLDPAGDPVHDEDG